jgi:hypothetical protein
MTVETVTEPAQGYRERLGFSTVPKDVTRSPNDLAAGQDSAVSGLGCAYNRRLNDLVESISMNVRGPCETDGQQSAGETSGESEPS